MDLTDREEADILRLMMASDELLLEELFNYVQDYLIREKSDWILENFIFVLHTVFRLTSCRKLQDYCLESICEDPKPFVSSKTFPSLDKDILFGLLKQDDFPVEEIVIWECLN